MSGAIIHTYETPEGPVECLEGPGDTVTLRSAVSGESIQVCRSAKDLADCGLDPSPLMSVFGRVALERRQTQRRAAQEARADLTDALTGRVSDYTMAIDGVSVQLTLSVESALMLADLVRGAK